MGRGRSVSEEDSYNSNNNEYYQCSFYYPGKYDLRCSKDQGDTWGSSCSECGIWFCNYHIPYLIAHKEKTLASLCIGCIVNNTHKYSVCYKVKKNVE